MTNPVRMRHSDQTTAVHSVRCTEGLWKAAKRRAMFEGVTMNFVMSSILEGYAANQMDLPKVTREFVPTRT